MTSPVLARLIEERERQVRTAEEIAAAAQREERDLSEAELQLIARHSARVDELDAQIRPLRELEERKAAADELRALAASAVPADTAAAAQPVVRVVREERTYRPDGPHRIVADLWRAERGDVEARERLARHQLEERASNSGSFAGLIIPTYLTDLVAPLARAGRPFANTWRTNPLPDQGMTIQVSRITTGSSTAAQSAEGAEVVSTDVDDTLLTVTVQTIAGEVTVSRQALERGALVEDVLMQDLAASYASTLDRALIDHVRNLSGTNAVAFTSGSPTVAAFWPKLADASQRIAGAVFRGATHVLMHPRRWGWIQAALDSSNRPLVPPSAPLNPMGETTGAYGAVGSLQGLTAVTDGHVPTDVGGTQDIVIVYSAPDLLLWEQGPAPQFLRFESVVGTNNRATLEVKLVAFGYVAFTAARYPAAVSIISGTGLTPPGF